MARVTQGVFLAYGLASYYFYSTSSYAFTFDQVLLWTPSDVLAVFRVLRPWVLCLRHHRQSWMDFAGMVGVVAASERAVRM